MSDEKTAGQILGEAFDATAEAIRKLTNELADTYEKLAEKLRSDDKPSE